MLKALRSTPAQRYVSVERFAADIERFQAGLPVEALDGSWRYRAGKFLTRHRRALSAATLAAVMLAWFAGTMALQARRIAAEQEKKARVASLVLDIFELSNPYVTPGEELTVREALERSSPVVAEGLRGQPDVRAELLHTTGSILRVLGFPKTAIEQLDEALAIRIDLHGEDHLEVAETLSALAAARRDLYEIDQAETLARRAVSMTRERLEPGDPGLVDPLLQLVSVYCAKGELENAEPLADEVIALASELPPGSRGEISVLQYLAQAHSRRGEYQEAVALNRRLLELVRGRFGDNYPTLIGTLSNMGMQLRRSGDLDAAKEAFEEALVLQSEVFGEDHQDPILINNYAGVHYAAGDFAAAERLYRDALAVVLDRGGPQQVPVLRLGLRIARTLTRQDAVLEAEREVRRLLAEEIVDDSHWMWHEARNILGESLSSQGRCEEAEPMLTESFQGILAKNKTARVHDDAFERLRDHFERCGKPEEIPRYEAMLSS